MAATAELAMASGDGDDYIAAGVLEAEIAANAPPGVYRPAQVSRGVLESMVGGANRREQQAIHTGFVAIMQREMPEFRS